MIRFALVLLITISGTASHTLEPLAGPDNFEGVCIELDGIYELAQKLISEEAPERAGEDYLLFYDSLVQLAFGPETRNTFDADLVDPLLSAMEELLFSDQARQNNPAGQILIVELQRLYDQFECV